MLIASEKFDVSNKLDRDMFQHVTYVSNRVLMLAKKEGVNRDSVESMGKYLWRLLRVVQAYNHKRRDVSLDEVVQTVNIFKSVFSGL